MIRTAVIGFGVSGRIFHAPFLAAADAYSLDFVVTGNPDRAAQATARYPHATVLSGPDELFARAAEIDLVVVGTPPATHAGLAATALDHGLHVVVDKPFTVTSAQGEALIEHARRVGRVLTVFQNRRWDGDFRTLRRLVQDGELGTVHTFESRFEWWKPQGPRDWKARAGIADGGGILFDLGTHLIDQARLLFGPVESVHADLARRGAGASDDDSFLLLTHTGGTRSRLFMSGVAALPGPRFHVLGSTAGYTKWGLDPQEDALQGGAGPGDDGFGREPHENWGTLGVRGHTRRVEPEPGDYGQFYRLLAAALDAGGELPVDPRDAVDVLRIIERAHARKGDLSR
ncbi:Gfo/Idh/MocA family protein [Amycolatopsis viridis]|uniref:Dehydrogenase n=1 Tax=Amycolatopsis viridis TaxID=185678 RepID=A0ABX0SWN5_9PSEU|nr:Gfo/Idh/MocA family oxidoreductase [Amycolatopsis viridis]NIH81392.1 putative dehydrogenase [Amycolatopsis viridis]